MKYFLADKIIAMLCVIALIVISCMPSSANAGGHHEKWYQARWCKDQGGSMEVMMPDGTRCDCVTATHAVEVDFACKWSEAIGQSLAYAMQSDKTAGIVLIIEKSKDRRYWIRLNSIIEHFKLPITTWIMTDKLPCP